MFKTMRSTELLAGLTRVSHESQFWPIIEIQTFIPWFYIETVERVGDDYHESVVLAASASHLKVLLQGGSQTAWIDRVQVITPGDLNGAGRWKMEVLVTLKEFFHQDGSPLGHSYEVDGGAIYLNVVDSAPAKTNENLVYSHDTRKLYTTL